MSLRNPEFIRGIQEDFGLNDKSNWYKRRIQKPIPVLWRARGQLKSAKSCPPVPFGRHSYLPKVLHPYLPIMKHSYLPVAGQVWMINANGIKDNFKKQFNPLPFLLEHLILKSCKLKFKVVTMSKEEIKYEISKVLDQFSDEALGELLAFLKELDVKKERQIILSTSLNKILREDKELLTKLAQ